MTDPTIHDTPRAKSNPAIRVVATLVLVILAVAVILLGLNVIGYEPRGWWN